MSENNLENVATEAVGQAPSLHSLVAAAAAVSEEQIVAENPPQFETAEESLPAEMGVQEVEPQGVGTSGAVNPMDLDPEDSQARERARRMFSPDVSAMAVILTASVDTVDMRFYSLLDDGNNGTGQMWQVQYDRLSQTSHEDAGDYEGVGEINIIYEPATEGQNDCLFVGVPGVSTAKEVLLNLEYIAENGGDPGEVPSLDIVLVRCSNVNDGPAVPLFPTETSANYQIDEDGTMHVPLM